MGKAGLMKADNEYIHCTQLTETHWKMIADTGGNPAGAKTKAQELVERNKVHVIIGPLAAFEAGQFLASPVYSRDFPPAKNLEK